MEVTDAAIDQVAESGYDPNYGARPLKRVIQRKILNPLATALMRSEFTEGSQLIVDYSGNGFTFQLG